MVSHSIKFAILTDIIIKYAVIEQKNWDEKEKMEQNGKGILIKFLVYYSYIINYNPFTLDVGLKVDNSLENN